MHSVSSWRLGVDGNEYTLHLNESNQSLIIEISFVSAYVSTWNLKASIVFFQKKILSLLFKAVHTIRLQYVMGFMESNIAVAIAPCTHLHSNRYNPFDTIRNHSNNHTV